MRYEDIKELLDEHPYKPFRVFMTEGKTFDILHRQFAFLMKSRLLVGIPSETPDHAHQCALPHIVRIEELRETGKR
jgi:hypothetical protein